MTEPTTSTVRELTTPEKITVLRTAGFTVKCHHIRKFKARIVKSNTETRYGTRGAYKRALESGQVYFLEANVQRLPTDKVKSAYADVVLPMNGWTTVEIYTNKDGTLIGKGKKNFTNLAFNKKIGLKAAFDQAIFDNVRVIKNSSKKQTRTCETVCKELKTISDSWTIEKKTKE